MDRSTAVKEVKANTGMIADRILQPAKKSGQWICPFCGHGTNGDGVCFNKKSWNGKGLHCFNCGFSGSIIDLIMEMDGVDFPQALDTAAAEIGIDIEANHGQREQRSASGHAAAFSKIEDDLPPADDQRDRDQRERDLPEAEAKDYTNYLKVCRENLKNYPEGQAYLAGRGISMETASRFWLGYDPEWRSPTAIQRLQDQGNDWLPPATPRIIIPTSPQHYIARDIRRDIPDNQKKYQKANEGSPAIFNGNAVYTDAQEVFVVEGAIDALSIMEAEPGAQAIALNSTANTEKLIKMVEQRRPECTFIICMDSDKAGETAATSLRAGLDRLNISNITADISCGHKDGNEALQADRERFRAAIQRALHQTSARPDSVEIYLQQFFQRDIEAYQQPISTGFSNLDKEAGGLYPGLYVLAAISSLGKTTLVHQMADNIAAGGQEVLFFSLEQSRLELVSKSLSRISVEIRKDGMQNSSLSIRRGYNRDITAQAAEKYQQKIGHRLSIIEGNFNCTVSFIGNYVRQYIRRNGVNPVVIVDYLQILQPESDGKRKQTVRETIDNTVTELKRLSREFGIPIIVICSENRASYLQPFSFESLKESGGIEYTADVVWGLQLECLNEDIFSKEKNLKEKRERVREAKAENPRKIELLCIKNRYGISSYSAFFDYFPANDMFRQRNGEPAAEGTGRKAGRRL